MNEIQNRQKIAANHTTATTTTTTESRAKLQQCVKNKNYASKRGSHINAEKSTASSNTGE